VGAGVLLLAGGLWLVTLIPGWLSPAPGTSTPAPGESSDATRRINATLYFVSDDGSDLVGVTREVPYGATAAEQARHILMALTAAPPEGQTSAIPAGTQVRAVFVGANGDAYVDLSPEASLAHPGGTLQEALTVFAVVNAVTANLPGVTTVQILVDGKEVDSLAGHIDLREPIGRSDAWIRKGQ
jgi:spore germination protein GerM